MAHSGAGEAASFKRWQPLTTGYFAEPLFHVDRAQPVTAESCTLGIVHSTEVLSSTDGPGLRYVVVLGQRPKHRPGHHIQAPPAFHGVSAILHDMQRVLVYLTPNGGGVTCSGTHPLHQHRFCDDLFQGAHDLGVTTCLHSQPPPTPPTAYARVLHHTDSAIVQVNSAPLPPPVFGHPGDNGATGNLLNFTGALEELAVPYHIRYLLVPEITDQAADIECLTEFARSRGPQLLGVQVMPHHLVTGSKRDMLGHHCHHRALQPYSLAAALQLVERMNALGVATTLGV